MHIFTALKNEVILVKKLALLFLSVCTLFSLFSCGGNRDGATESETTGEKIMASTKIEINGNPISEYRLLSESNTDGAASLLAAIRNFEGISLRTVKTMPEDGKVICLRADPHQSPEGCHIWVEGNTLFLSVYSSNFSSAAIGRFKTLLTGEKVSFPNGYDEILSYEPIAYEKVASGRTLQLIGDADREALSYRVGDSALIYIAAATTAGELVSVPYFHITTFNESKGKTSETYLEGASGVCSFSITPKNAGFIYWNVQACDANKKALSRFNSNADGGNHFVGSVGFDVGTLTPATALPEDFDSFWNGVAEEIKDTDPEVLKIEQVPGQSGYLAYYVELRCGTNAKGEPGVAAGYLTYPSNASETSKIGLRIAFQGYGIDIPGKNYQKKTAVFTVCAHSLELDRASDDEGYFSEMKNAIGRFGFESSSREGSYFLQMIRRDLTAAKFLVEYFGENGNDFWNGTDFEVSGTSMGAFQSTAVAALMKTATGKDASLLNLSLPWMCDLNGPEIGRKTSSFRPKYRAVLAYFDTVLFARLVTCKTTIFAGLGDQICPASGVMALYNTLSCEKDLTFEQNFSHAGGVGGEKYFLCNYDE